MDNAPVENEPLNGLNLYASNPDGIASMIVDVPLIDCGSSCDIRESTAMTVDATISSEINDAENPSNYTRKVKRGRRSKNLLDFGELDEALSHELRQGYRILVELMASSLKTYNEPFLNYPVDSSEDLLYRQKIPCPMWLTKMEEKFENKEYRSITDFVRDFRLMLENCYRFNGFDHYIARKAQHLEMMLEKKLTLLSGEIQAKTTFAATSGQTGPGTAGTPKMDANESINGDCGTLAASARRRVRRPPATTLLCVGMSGDSDAAFTMLQRQLLEENNEKEQDARRRQQEDRRRVQEQLTQELQQWEHSLVDDQARKEMSSMWELPHIGHFLSLCRVALNIPEVAQHELERILLMPAESSLLGALMTSLLSTPQQRLRLRNRPPMPFTVWEAKLRCRLDAWYIAADEMFACGSSKNDLLGIDTRFFGIVGRRNPLVSKSFADLTFLQRVWIVKALCEYCLHTQDTLREAIELQPAEEARESVLGKDSQGRSYLHFPQSHCTDVRVYRLAAVSTRALDRLPDEKLSNKEKTANRGVRRKAKATEQLREHRNMANSSRGGVQHLARGDSVKADDSSSSTASVQLTRQLESADLSVRRSARNKSRRLEMESNSYETLSDPVGFPASGTEGSDRLSSTILLDDVRAAAVASATPRRDSAACAEHLARSGKRHARVLESSAPLTDSIATTSLGDSVGASSPLEASPDAATFSESHAGNTAAGLASEDRHPVLTSSGVPASTAAATFEVQVEAPKQEEDVDNLVTHVSEFEAFETVARSVPELRSLIAKFCGHGAAASACRESNSAQERSSQASAVDREACELQLRENLQCMLSRLEPLESKLESSRRRIIEKLRREKATYKPLSTQASSEALVEWNSDEVASGEPSTAGDGAQDGGTVACKDDDLASPVRSATKRRIEQGHGVQQQPSPSVPNDSESWDVSSFGRPRKRRVIPNNVEDSGMPRKRTSAVASDGTEAAEAAVVAAAAPPGISSNICDSTQSSGASASATSTCSDTNASTCVTNDVQRSTPNGTVAAAPSSVSQATVPGTSTYTYVKLNGQPYMVATQELSLLLHDVQDFNKRVSRGLANAASTTATTQLWEKRYVRTTSAPNVLSTLLVAFGGSGNSQRGNPSSHTPATGMRTYAPGASPTAANLTSLASLLVAGATQSSAVHAVSTRAEDSMANSTSCYNAKRVFSALDCVAQRPVASATGTEQIPNSPESLAKPVVSADAINCGRDSNASSIAAPALHRMAAAVNQQQQSASQTMASSASEIPLGHATRSVALQAQFDPRLLVQQPSHQQQTVLKPATAPVPLSPASAQAPLRSASAGVLIRPTSSQAALRPASAQAPLRPTSVQVQVTPASVRAPVRAAFIQTPMSNMSGVAILQGAGSLVPAPVRSNSPVPASSQRLTQFIICQQPQATNAVIRVANGTVVPAILQTATSAARSGPMLLTTPMQSTMSQSLLLSQSPGQVSTSGNVALPMMLQFSTNSRQLQYSTMPSAANGDQLPTQFILR